MTEANPFHGAFFVGSLTLSEFWLEIHESADKWNGVVASDERKSIDSSLAGFLDGMYKLDSALWQSLCAAAGMTVYGAVALSWCEGAEISQVWDGWLASGFPLKPLPEYERPARFLNSALLPKTNSLAQIIAFCPDKTLPICAMIAALKEPLEFDLPIETLKIANPQIASFLKSRMEQRTDRTPEQDDLISIWTQTTKDTEWEI